MTRWSAMQRGALVLLLVATPSVTPVVSAQQPRQTSQRTDQGLYLLRVAERGYDLTIQETERGSSYSVLHVEGLAPTGTAADVVLSKASYDIAMERRFLYVFSAPPAERQPATSRGSQGRHVDVIMKVFMTRDANAPLRSLLGADYSLEAQQRFDTSGYKPVALLAMTYFGRQ